MTQGAVSADLLVKRIGRLFWDQRLEQGNLQHHPHWVVGRVIQYGKIADIQALSLFLGRERFLELVSEHRMTSRKVERFWQAMLRIEEVPCTKKLSRPRAAISWPA
jgi:hypothetical protein